MRCHFDFCGVTLLALCVSSVAVASEKEAQERAARKACLTGEYAKGAEILSDLFLDTRDPTYIFNQGRCYEQNNRYEEAMGRFREYLRTATNLSPSDRADVEKHIVDCQALLAKPEPAPAAPVVPNLAPSPASTPPPAAPTVVPVEQGVQASTAVPATRPGRGLRIAGIGCAVLGLASVGTGIYYYTRARSISDDVTGTINPSASAQQAGKDAETMQWVFYSIGAASLAAGTVLYLWGWHSAASSDAPVSTIAPMIGPGLAGVSAQGVF